MEDLLTSYWPWFQSGMGHPSSAVEFIKHLIDGLNRRVDLAESSFIVDYEVSYYIQSIHCFEKICVFERNDNQTLPPRHSRTYYETQYIMKPDKGQRWRHQFYKRWNLLQDVERKKNNTEGVEYFQKLMDRMLEEISILDEKCLVL